MFLPCEHASNIVLIFFLDLDWVVFDEIALFVEMPTSNRIYEAAGLGCCTGAKHYRNILAFEGLNNVSSVSLAFVFRENIEAVNIECFGMAFTFELGD